jgi:L-serine deaminase
MFALDVQQEIWFKLIKNAEKKELRIKEMLMATETKCLTHTYTYTGIDSAWNI